MPLPQQPPFEGITTIGALVNRIKSNFAPASYLQAPQSSPTATGGRTVAATQGQIPGEPATPRPQDSAVIALVGGTLTWTFATTFTYPPIVTWGIVGPPPSHGTTLYMGTPTATAVVITSDDATDARTLYLQALGNPD